MGVITTADEKLQTVRESLQLALEAADEFLNKDTWGHDEYKRDFIRKVNKIRFDISNALLDLRE